MVTNEIITVTPEDPAHRFQTLIKGFNLRWPEEGKEPAKIIICRTPAEVEIALNDTIKSGLRPTIRSGGHCYEGFVSNNQGGVIIDIGLMSGLNADVIAGDHEYGLQAMAGNQNWDGYVGLYKRTGKTLPGGSCYSVGAGGHIVGGGYGLLSRLHGLTVDWLAGVDILIPDGTGVKMVHARADNQYHDVFKFCRGAGGGNIGVITAYYFDDLPLAPQQVAVQFLQCPWSQFKDNPTRFSEFLDAYANYFIAADQDQNTYGLFTLLKLAHISAGHIGLVVQYTDPNGKLDDTRALMEFYEAMKPYVEPLTTYVPGGVHLPFIGSNSTVKTTGDLPPDTQVMDWLYATQTLNGSGNNQRGKYGSSYMKDGFTAAEKSTLFAFLTEENEYDSDFSQTLVQVDSYGGAINHPCKTNNNFDPGENMTSVPQRSSVLKVQYQCYWTDPARDEDYLSLFGMFYSNMHLEDGLNGTPYPFARDGSPSTHYEGCFINYPDINMLTGWKGHPNYDPNYSWGDLYYPGLYDELIATKAKYDPQDIFNHAMSIPVKRS
jgi:FAD/FMN-containing dehydrogenase